MSEAPLYVDDSANITISEIRSKCRRLACRKPASSVDYLQLMTSGRQVESRRRKFLQCRETRFPGHGPDIPVIAVAQLNRNLRRAAPTKK